MGGKNKSKKFLADRHSRKNGRKSNSRTKGKLSADAVAEASAVLAVSAGGSHHAHNKGRGRGDHHVLSAQNLSALSKGGSPLRQQRSIGESSEDDSWADDLTVVSEVTIAADQVTDPLGAERAFDELQEYFPLLAEKDAPTRVGALKHISHSLSNQVFTEFLEDHATDLTVMLKGCFRRGTSMELEEALKVCLLTALTLQKSAACAEFLDEMAPIILDNLVLNQKHVSAAVQVKAIKLWAAMVYLDSLPTSPLFRRTLDALEKMWQAVLPSSGARHTPSASESDETEEETKEDGDDSDAEGSGEDGDGEMGRGKRRKVHQEVSVTALRSWVLLLASLPFGGVASLANTYLADLVEMLEHRFVDMRIAAGEAITLFMASFEQYQEEEHEEEDELDVPDSLDFDVEMMVGFFDELINMRHKSHRGQLRVQKREFKLFSRSLQGHWAPKVVLKLRGYAVDLEGWNLWLAYHRLKVLLGPALQPHLLSNQSLHALFDMPDEVGRGRPHARATQEQKERQQQQFQENQRRHQEHKKGKRRQKRQFMFDDDT